MPLLDARPPLNRSLPAATDLRLTLSDGSRLTITGTVPTAAAARRTLLDNAALYVIGGTLAPHLANGPTVYTAAYAGRSQALRRVQRSYAYWIDALHAINVTGLALVHTREPWTLARLAHTEAMLIQTLSTGSATTRYEAVMTNTHSSAIWAEPELTDNEIRANQGLAAEIAHHVATHIHHGRTNVGNWPSPAGNARELAVKVLHHAERALDADEIVDRLADMGYRPEARTHYRTVVRDLGQRDRLRGTSRFHAETLTGARGARPRVRVYWAPHLNRHDAIADYLAAQNQRPNRIRRHEPHPPARTRPSLNAIVSSRTRANAS